MTSTLVDSNVLLDVLSEDADWVAWAMDKLRASREAGPLVINPLIYAETAPSFDDIVGFDRILESNGIAREDLPWDAAYLAGQRHAIYRKKGGSRERTLPDFLIGAHAVVKRHRLLTRDARRFRSYFPSLDIIAPDTHP
jgi:predicted nucleic acid-binding protein